MDAMEISLLDTVRELKDREPYEPFTIVMTSDDRYKIAKGENLIIGKSRLFYAETTSERVSYIRINQIIGVEQFDSPKRRPVRRRRAS